MEDGEKKEKEKFIYVDGRKKKVIWGGGEKKMMMI